MTRETICLAAVLAMSTAAQAQLIISDNYNATGSGTGFALGSGANSGINPPTTRLTGSEANGLRYYTTTVTGGKATTAYSITGSTRLAVAAAANPGRITLSSDGSTPYNFAPALGIGSTYDIKITMANTTSGTTRCSFALGTAETDANSWDFGIQLYKALAADSFYTVGKRIDSASSGVADLNAAVTTAGTGANQLSFLMRVYDAGAETSTYNSRVQLSLDGGNSFFYDTATDASLVNGFHFDGSGRYIMWDIAGSTAATYDSFSVTVIPEPSTLAVATLGGIAMIWAGKRRKALNQRQ
jgi:hypothetical protein